MSYRHTQIGYVTGGFLVIALGVMVWTVAPAGFTAGEVAILLLGAATTVLLATLTVEVTPDTLRVWFGPGWIRRTIRLREIESAALLRVPWYVGWGVRWRGFWLYNVSGRMAVMVRLRGGQRFGIGSDQPEALLQALSRAGVTVERPPGSGTPG